MDRIIILGFVFLSLTGCATSTSTPSKTKPIEPSFLSSVARGALLNTYSMFNEYKKEDVRIYRCDELTQEQAFYLYRNGHRYLDRDKDGLPCE